MEPNKNPNPNMNASNKNNDVDPNPHPNDWRTLFPVVDRQRTINAVLYSYKSLLRFPDNMPGDYLFKYKKSVVEFECAAFKEATNETDYLSGIFRRMDAMMTKYLSAASSSNSKPSNGNDGSNTQEGQVQEANDPDADPNPDPNDWRTLFTVEDRQRAINAVLDTYKSRLYFPANEFSGDYLFRYKRSIVEFESAAFMEAANEMDYLYRICWRTNAMMKKSSSAASSTPNHLMVMMGSNTQEGQEAKDSD